MAGAPEDLAVAVEHFRAGRVQEALALAARHEIENALGTEHARRGELEAAERHYREAIALSPGFFKPHNNLGNVLRDRGELEAAVEQYREALRIEPSAQRVHANLGNTLHDLGLWAEAVESYRRSLALHAGAPVALRLAELLEALGDPEPALLAYAEAARLGDTTALAKGERLRLALQRSPVPAPPPTGDAGGRSRRRPLVESAGDELRALLAPVSPAAFVHEYWGKKPLFVKGFAGKYQGFFDGAAFIEAVAKPGRAPPDALRASFDKRVAAPGPSPSGAPESGTLLFTITPEQAGVLHEAGATICITEIEGRVPRLASFLAAVKRQLGYPGKLAFNAYASPAGAGFNWHFDARIASTLQIEGTKRWRFSRRPALEWPRGNGVRQTDGSAKYGEPIPRADWERLAPLDENDVATVLLEPGDLLILPAGVWHDACGGTAGSVALNLAFLPFSHTNLVEEVLSGLLDSDPGWRSAMPLLPAPEGGPGAVDPAGLVALRRQLERAGDALRSLAADSPEMVRVWASFVQNASPLVPGAATPPRAPITATSRLRVRADGDVYVQSVEGGAKLHVSIGARLGMELAGPTMRFVQRALVAREMVAGDCIAWGFAWAEVERLLGHLVDEGLLEQVAP
jgi:hypothetical protein